MQQIDPGKTYRGTPSDDVGARTFTVQDFQGASGDPFLEGYEMWVPPCEEGADDAALYAGVHEARRLLSGPKIEVSALTAVCNGSHRGIMKPSLTLLLVIDGAPMRLAFGAGPKLTVERGQALLVTMPDTDAFTFSHRRGDRSRSLLLQTRPQDLVDPELADLVARATAATTVTRLPAASWSAAMAPPAPDPEPIRRLAEESCAMGLLAQALRTVTGVTAVTCVGRAPPMAGGKRIPAGTITAGDRRKMLRVRDQLLASPDKAHRLADLACEAGVSVTTLKTKFAAVFGQPVFACLRDIRLDTARAGIEREGWTVSQAAYEVGYQHLGSFAAAFHRKFGARPSEVRRRA